MDSGGTSMAPATAPPAASVSRDSVWGAVRRQLQDPRIAAFYALAFLFGAANGCINYLMLYLKELGEDLGDLQMGGLIAHLLAGTCASATAWLVAWVAFFVACN
jgi:hypothetical protein